MKPVSASAPRTEPCLHRASTYVSVQSDEAYMPLVDGVKTHLNAGDAMTRHSTLRGWRDAAQSVSWRNAFILADSQQVTISRKEESS